MPGGNTRKKPLLPSYRREGIRFRNISVFTVASRGHGALEQRTLFKIKNRQHGDMKSNYTRSRVVLRW